MVATPPAWRMRSRLEEFRRISSGVSNTMLASKTRGRHTTKPAAPSRRRAERASFTTSLISVSCVPCDIGMVTADGRPDGGRESPGRWACGRGSLRPRRARRRCRSRRASSRGRPPRRGTGSENRPGRFPDPSPDSPSPAPPQYGLMLLADERELGLGRRFVEEGIDAGLFGDLGGGQAVVAGDHDGADSHRAELVEALAHAFLDRVLEIDHAEDLAVAGDP